MGILKVLAGKSARCGENGYTDQRSDGDTERGSSEMSMRHWNGVTQTNDPMGILKDAIRHVIGAPTKSYTDQRSDGDTERQAVIGSLLLLGAVTQTNDPMGILKVSIPFLPSCLS